jgi:5-methylcytosine-specific restriction protein A
MGEMPLIENPLGGRRIEEWIGDHPDQRIPDRVKDRIFIRHNGKCYLTGRKLFKGEYDFDHIKRLADGGQHRETNLAPIWRPKHREKTGEENSAGAKADRIRRKANGTWPKTKAPIRSRGFSSTRLWQPNNNPDSYDSSEGSGL